MTATATPSAAPVEDDATASARPIFAREDRISELFGIPVPTLRTRRVRSPGSPPFLRVGRAIYYKVADVEAWLEAKAEKGGG